MQQLSMVFPVAAGMENGMAEGEGALKGKIIGGYQVGDLIGVGPLAEVYSAWHPGLAQTVALKVFSSAVAAKPAYAQRLRETATHAARLDARHILPLYGFAQDGDALYLAMPLMPQSLRALLRRSHQLPLTQAAPLLRRIGHGLAAAHAGGILHRDLKPENVLLDTQGNLFVSDFGIGYDLPPDSAERDALGLLASLIGTPAYMAPEQLHGQPTDQRTDVYALGVIYYEMLSGSPPFRGNTIYEVAAQALTRRVPSLSKQIAISPLVDKALLRALARDPAERWPTVQRFLVGLDAVLPATLDEPAAPGDVADSAADVTSASAPERPQEPRRRAFTTTPLPAVTPDTPDVPPRNAESHGAATTRLPIDELADETPAEDEPASNSGMLPTPDLRLFRVDPLPPISMQRRPTMLLLAAVALLMLAVLVSGGVLLANAAQSAQPKAGGVPTSPPATLAPTQYFFVPTVKPSPTATAKPVIPPAHRPTATPRPMATATPIPSASVTPSPVVPVGTIAVRG
jgi:serine/threonine protein kinase